MHVSPWAVAAGGAALLLGGIALAAQSSGASSATPTPTTPATPIPIVSGHRYEVTLTFGAPTTAAALLASVVPNLQAGLDAVAPGVYRFVHASAPNNTQVVYVVDAIAPPPGSTWSESPQTFFADLNAATLGGIGVAVLDLGPTPTSAPAPPGSTTPGGGTPPPLPPAAPPSGPLSASSPVTADAVVRMAQTALSLLQKSGVLATSAVPVNGNASDPATLSAVAVLQDDRLPAGARSGVLDYLTFGLAVTTSLVRTGDPSTLGTDSTITDSPTVALAQGQLAAGIGLGSFPNIDYGAAQINGDPTDAAFRAAMTTAAGQFNTTVGKAILPADGSVDLVALAFLLTFGSSALLPRLTGGIAVATPATPITDGNEIVLAQSDLQQLSSGNAALGGVTRTGTVDAATSAAVKAYQAVQTGLQHRTTPGVLDLLTFASLQSAAVVQSHTSFVGSSSPLPVARGRALSAVPLVGALQEAVGVLAAGRLSVAGASYASSQANGIATDPAFVAALKKIVSYLNTNTGPNLGFTLDASGALDYDLFASLYVVAYM